MAYTTAADVKAYLKIEVPTDDTLIGNLIARAQSIIENYTGRVFEAATATKCFGLDELDCLFDGRFLYLFGVDLLTVTILTNGNEVAITDYRLEPRNQTPKYIIRLGEGVSWEFTDSDSEVSVTGTWGYSTTAPADIVHACIRLAAFLYRQKDTSADIDRPLMTGDGVTIMPSAIPQDVKSILDNYRRRI